MFGGNGLDQTIETYIDEIVSRLNCNEEEKIEIIDEIRDHLYLLKNEYIDAGFNNEQATEKALESFGEHEQLTNGLQDSLSPFFKVFKIGAWILFGLYSFIILFMLLFQRILFRITDFYRNGDTFNIYVYIPMESEGLFEYLKFNSNIIPFQNTIGYLTGADRFNIDIIISNTLGNILIFLPLGIFLPLLFEKYSKFTKVLIASTIISFSIEVLQITLQIGQFDIDDIILNVVGSIIGFFFFKMLKHINTLSKGGLSRRTIG